MSKKVFAIVLAASLMASVHVARAQQAAGKRPRIGWLTAAGSSPATRAAVRQGLRERGYIEGQHFTFHFRVAEGKFERLPVLAAELVDLKVDVILTGGSTIAPCALTSSSERWYSRDSTVGPPTMSTRGLRPWSRARRENSSSATC